ncbi:MAG: class I SAM-dependent methyltransferase [Candidatus Binataceae bacterium]|nr:class I SAM-dependent methyltransferase [Candidatus Binataceae bacterium]
MKKQRPSAWAIILIGVALFAGPIFSANARPIAAASASEIGPIPESGIPPYITAAVNSPERPAADRALDTSRKPAQMLTFFGIKPGTTVADLAAGAGYTTELLALVVGPDGKVYSQNYLPPKLKKLMDLWHQRLAQPALKNVVAIEKRADDPALFPVPPASLDAVVINMDYHDFVNNKINVSEMNRYLYRMLKPGGVYGIIDNSAQPGSGIRDVGTLHRIDERSVIKQVTAAGFRLKGSSSVLRNPSDDRTWFIMKHRGQQDRFMLKFVKPTRERRNPS